MKATNSLKERLFVMYLNRELEFKRLRGEVPEMKNSVQVADNDMTHTIETIKELGL